MRKLAPFGVRIGAVLDPVRIVDSVQLFGGNVAADTAEFFAAARRRVHSTRTRAFEATGRGIWRIIGAAYRLRDHLHPRLTELGEYEAVLRNTHWDLSDIRANSRFKHFDPLYMTVEFFDAMSRFEDAFPVNDLVLRFQEVNAGQHDRVVAHLNRIEQIFKDVGRSSPFQKTLRGERLGEASITIEGRGAVCDMRTVIDDLRESHHPDLERFEEIHRQVAERIFREFCDPAISVTAGLVAAVAVKSLPEAAGERSHNVSVQ